MMNLTVELASLIEKELSSDLKNVLLLKDTSKYYLFGKYLILPKNNGYQVLTEATSLEFASLKNATAWCIFDNECKYTNAHKIHILDLKLSSVDMDISIHKQMLKNSTKHFNTLVIATKLQEDVFKRRQVVSEIKDCLEISKIIQFKNFNKRDLKIKRMINTTSNMEE